MQEKYEAEIRRLREKLKKELRLTLIVCPLVIILSVVLTRFFGVEEELSKKIVGGAFAVILVLYAVRKAKTEKEIRLEEEKTEGELNSEYPEQKE